MIGQYQIILTIIGLHAILLFAIRVSTNASDKTFSYVQICVLLVPSYVYLLSFSNSKLCIVSQNTSLILHLYIFIDTDC